MILPSCVAFLKEIAPLKSTDEWGMTNFVFCLRTFTLNVENDISGKDNRRSLSLSYGPDSINQLFLDTQIARNVTCGPLAEQDPVQPCYLKAIYGERPGTAWKADALVYCRD